MRRKFLIVVLVVSQIVLMLVAASIVLEGPLDVPPGEGAAHYVRARSLSEPALAGMASYGDHCSACHGDDAEGGEGAPGLIDRSYAKDFRDSRLFHEEVALDIPAHRDLMAPDQPGSAFSFNKVELMSKFLREMNRKKELDASL